MSLGRTIYFDPTFNQCTLSQVHIFFLKILEPCFKYKVLDAAKSMCSLLKMVSLAFPPEAANTTQDVKMLYQKVEELIQKHLAAVAIPQTSGEDNSGSMVSFVLYVIKTLAEVHKNIVEPVNMVRLLQRLARDMGSSIGSHVRQVLHNVPGCCIYYHLVSTDSIVGRCVYLVILEYLLV